MARFPNSLGFLIVSGLINNTRSEVCAPVITAVVRDLKKYMKMKQQATGQRILPVGFGGGQYDGDVKVLNYLAAGDESSSIDLWTVCSLSRVVHICGDLQVLPTDCQQQCTAFASDQNLGKGLNRLDGLVRSNLVALVQKTKTLTYNRTGRLVPPRQNPHPALRVRHQHRGFTDFPRRSDSLLTRHNRRLLRRLRVRVLAG
jgi:hypothetical protein